MRHAPTKHLPPQIHTAASTQHDVGGLCGASQLVQGNNDMIRFIRPLLVLCVLVALAGSTAACTGGAGGGCGSCGSGSK